MPTLAPSLRITLLATLTAAVAPSQVVSRVSVDSSGGEANGPSSVPVVSADGRYVAFESSASNLVPGDTNGVDDAFVHDRMTGVTTRVSVDSAGLQANGQTTYVAISADGRFVSFASSASNLVAGDTNLGFDIVLRDMQAGSTSCVSVNPAGVPGNGSSNALSMSADGRYVAFQSFASDLVPGDTNGVLDVFVRDVQTGSTTRVSVDSAGHEAHGGFSDDPAISWDGRYVAFTSSATNLVPNDTNGLSDVFVHDCMTGTTIRVSTDSSGAQANGNCFTPSISGGGRFVAFSSLASNLVLGDTNGVSDIFLHDCQVGTTSRVSLSSLGAQGDGGCGVPSLSWDGRFVTFSSASSNLAPNDTNGAWDVFLHDTLTGATTLVSADQAGIEGNGASEFSSLSPDARYLVYTSVASNLVPHDLNGTYDIFLLDRGAASAFVPLCFGDGTGHACPCSNVGSQGHGCDNSSATGGSQLSARGTASLSADAAQLTATGELSSALSLVLEGDAAVPALAFGDGLRCAGGSLKRLYLKQAQLGTVSAPEPGDPSLSQRAAALGDVILLGSTRVYQVYYRDPNLGFCVGGFNASNAIAIAWGS